MDILPMLFLVAGALTLASIALVIVVGLFRSQKGGKAVSFFMEVPAKEGQDSKPSVSRLQMLIWNFVIAFAFLYILSSLDLNQSLEPITVDTASGTTTTNLLQEALKALFNPQILILLGISNGTYLAGKLARQGGTQPQTEPAAAKKAVEKIPSSAMQSVTAPPNPGPAGPVG